MLRAACGLTCMAAAALLAAAETGATMAETGKHAFKGDWITCPGNAGLLSPVAPSPVFRTEFELSGKPHSVQVFLCGLGLHELRINGVKADDRLLTPNPTQYDKRVSYVKYEIARLLKPGRNCLSVLLGNGVFNCHYPGPFGFSEQYNAWRMPPLLCCDVLADGKWLTGSSVSWRCMRGPVLFDSLREGESYDARKEAAGWMLPGFDDRAFPCARQCAPPAGLPCEEDMEGVKKLRDLSPVKTVPLPLGALLYDFGTTLSGWCEIRVQGKAGARVRILYGERLTPGGDLTQKITSAYPDGARFQEDRYTLKGGAPESWHARFTYHGFRYAKIIPEGDVQILQVQAQEIMSAFRRIGRLETSDAALNHLQEITLNSYRANFIGLPTDCPHREKNAWTGDAAIALETGLFNYDARRGYAHFERIIADSQRLSGEISTHVPTTLWGYEGSCPTWDSFCYEAPYQIFLFTGDDAMIREFYPMLKKHTAYWEKRAENHLVHSGLGDWCSPIKTESEEVLLSCFYAHNVRRMAYFARHLGKRSDAKKYERLAETIRQTINRVFYEPGNGSYRHGRTTDCAVALAFNIPDRGEREKILQALVRKIRQDGHKSNFGIFGAKYIPRILAENGYAEDAYKILTQKEYPGYGNLLLRGATALWERWDGSDSLAHVMFGDPSAWLYRYAAGIVPMEEGPGFRSFRLAPKFIPALESVHGEHLSPQGKIISRWKREGKKIIFSGEIPPDCTAEIALAPGKCEKRGAGPFMYTLHLWCGRRSCQK